MERGTLVDCSAVSRETKEYFDDQSTPDLWVTERCLVEKKYRQRSSVLYADYVQWKKSRGEDPLGQKRWGDWVGRRYTRDRNGTGATIYIGLDLVEPTPQFGQNQSGRDRAAGGEG